MKKEKEGVENVLGEERKTLDEERYCRNCVNGQDVGSRFSSASWVYCSLHKGYKQYYDVCPDHRFIEEEFDLSSRAPFTDWMKGKSRSKSGEPMVRLLEVHI